MKFWKRDDLLTMPVIHTFSFNHLAHKTIEELLVSVNNSLNEMKKEVKAVINLINHSDGRLTLQLIVFDKSFYILYKG